MKRDMLGQVVAWTVIGLYVAGIYGFTDVEIAEISETIERTRQCQHIPGMTVALLNNSEPVRMRNGYGWSDIENNKEADGDTAFCIGSITKSFTATLIARFMDENRINITWDTPIRDILTDSFYMSDPMRTAHVSLRDLLAHKTGIPDYTLSLFTGYQEGTTRQQLTEKMRYMCPTQPFRVNFLYNNYMYALAAYVLEVLTKTTWEELVQQYIFDELGMVHSGFVDVGRVPAELALPYISRGGSFHAVDQHVAKSVTPAGPAGSICASAGDMTKWIQYHLNVTQDKWQITNISQIYQRQIAFLDNAKNMYRPDSEFTVVRVAYGLGMMELLYRGHQVFFHTGGISTYLSAMYIIPATKSGFFMSLSGINERGHLNPHLEYYLLDKVLGLPSKWNEEKLCDQDEPVDEKDHDPGAQNTTNREVASDFDRPTKDPSSVGKRDLSPYVGNYQHPAFDSVQIYRNETDQSLHMKLGRLGHAILSPTQNPHEFTGQWKDRLLGLSTYLKLNHLKNPDFKLLFDDIDSSRHPVEANTVKIQIETVIDSVFKRHLTSEKFYCGPDISSAITHFSSSSIWPLIFAVLTSLSLIPYINI